MSNAEVKSNQAKNEFRNGNYTEAKRYWDQALEAAGGDDPIHTYYSNKCACNQKVGKWTEALEDANSCVSYKPTWSKGYQRKGACLEQLRRYEEALYAFERANELAPNDKDTLKSIEKLRCYTGAGSRGGSSSSSAGGFNFSNPAFGQIKGLITQYLSQAMTWWTTANETQKYSLGAGALIVLYFLYSTFFGRSSYGYDGYYDDYGYGYGGGMSNWIFSPYGGLTWASWGTIMLAAWKLPPMFPNELGQYALPFFGMNMTTFMWLLRMLTSQGGRGMRGGFGGRRGGYGRGMY